MRKPKKPKMPKIRRTWDMSPVTRIKPNKKKNKGTRKDKKKFDYWEEL